MPQSKRPANLIQFTAAENEDRMLNVRQAAALCGMRPKSMYDLASQGRIPHLKLFGRTLRFRESDIRRVLAEAEIPVKPAMLSTGSSTVGFSRASKTKKLNGESTVEPSLKERVVSSKKPN